MLYVRRESLDETGWRQREWNLGWGGGDVLVSVWSLYSDAAQPRLLGCPEGVRTDWHLASGNAHRIARRYAAWNGAPRPRGDCTWRLNCGIALGKAEYRHWEPGLWGGGVQDAFCHGYFAVLPCWLLALLVSLLPAQRLYAFARRRRRARRALRGLCPACAYDDRATPDPAGPLLDRCPECGRTTTPHG